MASRQEGPELRTQPGDDDSATDGDLDIAYALLLAHAQWGGEAQNHYLAQARTLMTAIMESEVNQTIWAPKLGDWIVDGKPKKFRYGTRSSDFMLQHWHTFSAFAATPAEQGKWMTLRARIYDVLGSAFVNFAPSTGLMPDFFTYDPAPHRQLFVPVKGPYLEDNQDGAFYYNACRTPWRVATDYLITGDTRALTQLSTLNLFLQRITGRPDAAGRLYRKTPLGDPEQINAGYTLAGAPLYPRREDSGSCFDAPFAVSAMIGRENQAWLNLLWAKLVVSVQPGAPSEEYYDDTVKLLCLIVITGNWWDPATGQ